MKKLSVLLAAAAVFCFTAPAFAAPVFPDVPEEHWARDAVANLAASGLVEGYPDGTFKGDRAATRYEMAMVVARFLAKNDQEHATFATKAELEELRQLVNQLKSELDALGVRVTNLEDSVADLDKRVTELERITFYGELDAIFTTQGFTSDSHFRTFNGWAWVEDGQAPEALAGSVAGANLTMGQHGLLPTMDYRTGRPLTNGTGVSAVAKLGINAKVSDDIDAGLELAAYTAVGDPIVNSFYGVQQPYMSNVFAGQGNYNLTMATGNAQSLLTAVTLDNFWVKHKPTGIKLTVGSFGELNMDSILFAGQPNPNINGASYIPNYGIRINGTTHFLSDMDWEVFYTSLPDANAAPAVDNNYSVGLTDGDGYNTYAYGIDVGWRFKGGNFKLGYLRAMNDGTNYTGFGLGYGILQGGMQWVSPLDYGYNNWWSGVNNMPPVFMNPDGASLYGPQSTTNWSAHFDYTWEDSKIKPRFFVEYASSNYKPNDNSDFSTTGGALRAGLGATFFDDTLDLDITYKSVEPNYDPFTLRYPVNVNSMWRLPNFSYYPNMYQLHDSDVYTNNREGWDFKLTYRFKDDRGKAWVTYKTYEQVENSVCDTVTSHPSLLGGYFAGYEPGFIDSIFTPLAGNIVNMDYLYYTDLSYLSRPVSVTNLDDTKGKVTSFDIGVNYKFQNNLGVELSYYSQNFKRDTNLSIGQLWFNPVTWTMTDYGFGTAAAQNYIDLDVSGFHIGLSYPFNERFTGKIGYDHTTIKGHYDPAGIHADYAFWTGSHDYTNIDTTQSVPYIGFDYKLSQNTEWGLNLQFFSTSDSADIYDRVTPSTGEIVNNPYDWNGIQLMTEFKVKF